MRAFQWLVILVYLILSSLFFTLFFELGRYYTICDPIAHNLSNLDKILLFWFLTAKTLALFLPFLPVWGLLILLVRFRLATVSLNIVWSMIFFYQTADLVAFSFAGMHLWEFLPNTQGSFKNLCLQIWRLTAERMAIEAVAVVVLFSIIAPVFFYLVKWTTQKLVDRFKWLLSTSALITISSVFFIIILGILPLSGPSREQVYETLPFSPALKSSLYRFCERVKGSYYIGRVSTGLGLQAASLFPEIPHYDQARLLAGKILEDAIDPKPLDLSAFVRKSNLPNILLIVFESFRHDAISPNCMKKLDKWSEGGLRFQRHYSGSNCTAVGLFSLFYSRNPLAYEQTLDRDIPPQMLESLKRSGYEITFITHSDVPGFGRLDEWISPKYCDRLILEGSFAFREKNMKEWPEADRRKLRHVSQILNGDHAQPQFVFVFLASSHFRYMYPPEFEIFKEKPSVWKYLDPKIQMDNHFKRYVNSLLFLESEVFKVFDSIDLNRTIIMITGDHGQSMREDGVFAHCSRMSEIQTRVPFVMAGPGIEARTISTATAHYDILPTLLNVLNGGNVPVHNSDGRDLISDRTPADEVSLAQRRGPNCYGIVVIDGKNRLHFRTDVNSQGSLTTEFTGLLDEAGVYQLKAGESESMLGVCP